MKGRIGRTDGFLAGKATARALFAAGGSFCPRSSSSRIHSYAGFSSCSSSG
jgi:hypothetical protein